MQLPNNNNCCCCWSSCCCWICNHCLGESEARHGRLNENSFSMHLSTINIYRNGDVWNLKVGYIIKQNLWKKKIVFGLISGGGGGAFTITWLPKLCQLKLADSQQDIAQTCKNNSTVFLEHGFLNQSHWSLKASSLVFWFILGSKEEAVIFWSWKSHQRKEKRCFCEWIWQRGTNWIRNDSKQFV